MAPGPRALECENILHTKRPVCTQRLLGQLLRRRALHPFSLSALPPPEPSPRRALTAHLAHLCHSRALLLPLLLTLQTRAQIFNTQGLLNLSDYGPTGQKAHLQDGSEHSLQLADVSKLGARFEMRQELGVVVLERAGL